MCKTIVQNKHEPRRSMGAFHRLQGAYHTNSEPYLSAWNIAPSVFSFWPFLEIKHWLHHIFCNSLFYILPFIGTHYYFLSLSHELYKCISRFPNIFFIVCTNLFTCVFSNIQNYIYIDVEAENVPNVGQNRHREERYIQEEGCLPTTTYSADISDISWEINMAQRTL